MFYKVGVVGVFVLVVVVFYGCVGVAVFVILLTGPGISKKNQRGGGGTSSTSGNRS